MADATDVMEYARSFIADWELTHYSVEGEELEIHKDAKALLVGLAAAVIETQCVTAEEDAACQPALTTRFDLPSLTGMYATWRLRCEDNGLSVPETVGALKTFCLTFVSLFFRETDNDPVVVIVDDPQFGQMYCELRLPSGEQRMWRFDTE